MTDTISLNAKAGAVDRPQGCTHFKLRQLMRQLSQHYDAQMAVAGLKTTQYSLLSHVLKLGPVRPGDLAAAMKMDASTLTRNVRLLIDAGWITLDAGSDARSRWIQLTDAGRLKRQEAARCWKLAQQDLNARIGEQRVHALHVLLDEAIERLDKPAPGTGSDEDGFVVLPS